MARCIVSVDRIRQLKNQISSYSNQSDVSISTFRQQVSFLMEEFETKLNELEKIMDEKEQAYNDCEWRHRNDEGSHCSAEANAYAKAQARYSQCYDLVSQALAAVDEYDGKVESYRSAKADLVSRASTGLGRVEALIGEYLSGSATLSANNFGGSIPVIINSGIPGAELKESSGMQSAIHITGGDKIASVLPKGSKTDPVKIDFDAMGHKFDYLPDIIEPDKETLNAAAISIFGLLAAGGMALGARELLLQQKADEIFEKQYGISRTELLIGTGSQKQKEYVAAYNNIYRGLKNEIKEVQKKELKNNIKNIEECLSGEEQNGIESIERANKLRVDLENQKNHLLSLEDGKNRPHIPYERTYVGGLSEKSLIYMMDYGKMTQGRAIVVFSTMSDSEFSFLYHHDDFYTFKNSNTLLEVKQDGSEIRIEKIIEKGCDGGVDIGANGTFSKSETLWKLKSSSESKPDTGFHFENHLGASVNGYCSLAAQNKEVYHISEHGFILSDGFEQRVVNVEGELGAEYNKGVEIIGGGKLSVAHAEIKGAVLSHPLRLGDTFYQIGGEIKGGLGPEVGADVRYNFSLKGIEAKSEISPLLFNFGGKIQVRGLSLNDLPPEISHRLADFNPTIDEKVADALEEVASVTPKSILKIGEMEMAKSKALMDINKDAGNLIHKAWDEVTDTLAETAKRIDNSPRRGGY